MGSKEVPQTRMSRFDYIVAGAGASGLSLVMHIIDSGNFKDKTILLVDNSRKKHNDRTWCFWEKTPGLFEPVVYKRWSMMWFHGVNNASKLHNISPYEYKMIRGLDFYDFCFEKIGKQKNIVVQYGSIENIVSNGAETYLILDGTRIDATYIFSSLPREVEKKEDTYFLWQHFKGWIIETKSDLFNADEATLMDFRIDQANDTRFVYVMPFTKNSALVEYTVFSEDKLADEEYDENLEKYCASKLHISAGEYKVIEEEFGMIPMTNYPFSTSHNKIIYIGTAGGRTKASSGYTFTFIQKHSRQIVYELSENKSPDVRRTSKKFNFYDSILLRILVEKKLPGAAVFSRLFEHNEIHEVFKFLDNETSIGEDLKLIGTLPKSKFISAAVAHLLQ
jgi:lycopene beta-cyclase